MDRFLEALRVQRWDDHRNYHHSRINQSLHLLSAMSFVRAYVLGFKESRRGSPDRMADRHGQLAGVVSHDTSFQDQGGADRAGVGHKGPHRPISRYQAVLP